jgi:hypothetical protein
MSGLFEQMQAAQLAKQRGLLSHTPDSRPPVDVGRSMADALQMAGLLTAPIPVLGDAVGLLGDAAMYAAKPEERTMGNAALSALGVLPFFPSLAGKLGKAGKLLDVTDADTFKAVKAAMGGDKIPEGEIRQAVAQYNATLPKRAGGLGLSAENTAAERAGLLGFTQPAYHGTAADIKEFDPKLRGTATNNARSAKMATWTVDQVDTARGYAENAATIAPVRRLVEQADAAGRAGEWDRYDELLRQAEALEATDLQRGQNIMPLVVAPGKQNVFDAKGGEFTDLEGGLGQNMLRARSDGANSVMFKNLSDHPSRSNMPAAHTGVFSPTDIRSRFAAFDPRQRDSRNLLASMAGVGLLSPAFIAAMRDRESQ